MTVAVCAVAVLVLPVVVATPFLLSAAPGWIGTAYDAYNAQYVLDVLKNIGAETISLELTQPLSPGVIRPKGDQDYLCVIMPMRV